jgi:hypothetical protein
MQYALSESCMIANVWHSHCTAYSSMHMQGRSHWKAGGGPTSGDEVIIRLPNGSLPDVPELHSRCVVVSTFRDCRSSKVDELRYPLPSAVLPSRGCHVSDLATCVPDRRVPRSFVIPSNRIPRFQSSLSRETNHGTNSFIIVQYIVHRPAMPQNRSRSSLLTYAQRGLRTMMDCIMMDMDRPW